MRRRRGTGVGSGDMPVELASESQTSKLAVTQQVCFCSACCWGRHGSERSESSQSFVIWVECFGKYSRQAGTYMARVTGVTSGTLAWTWGVTFVLVSGSCMGEIEIDL